MKVKQQRILALILKIAFEGEVRLDARNLRKAFWNYKEVLKEAGIVCVKSHSTCKRHARTYSLSKNLQHLSIQSTSSTIRGVKGLPPWAQSFVKGKAVKTLARWVAGVMDEWPWADIFEKSGTFALKHFPISVKHRRRGRLRNGRLYQFGVQSLPKSLRPKHLISLDATAMNFMILYKFAPSTNEGGETERLRKVIEEGTIYDLVAEKLGITRKEAKKGVNSGLNQYQQFIDLRKPGRFMKVLVEMFPMTMMNFRRRLFERVERWEDAASEVVRNVFSRVEGAIFVKALEKLLRRGIGATTIHDSIWCQPEDLETVREELMKRGREVLGLNIHIKEERA